MTLQQLRKQIDRLDSQILKLLNRRAAMAQRIGALKRKRNLPIYDGERERAVLQRLIDSSDGPLPPASTRKIFSEILRRSRELQIKK